MVEIEKSIIVNAPLSSVYDQWTQFEQFPQFMQGVMEVRQLDDQHWHWRAQLFGREEEWDAEITQQIPEQRISWQSIAGARRAGSVGCEAVHAGRTLVTLQIEYEPQGVRENISDVLEFVLARVHGDLERFKEFIEARETEPSAWCGKLRDHRKVA